MIPDTNEEEEDTYGDEILNADEKNEWKGNSCSPHLPVHNRQKIADHTHSEMQNREWDHVKTLIPTCTKVDKKNLLNKDFKDNNDYEYNQGMKI